MMLETYYDNLAPYYKLLYADWEASIKRQADVLDDVIREFIGLKARTVLDAACGIGTQSFGLARLGYQVTASDISEGEIAQAQSEAEARNLEIAFEVADMRELWQVHQQQFDVVLACDNAVPHLLSDAEILVAFEQFYRCLKPGGGCLLSVRDYAALKQGGFQFYPRIVHQTDSGQVVIFDVWTFAGDFYDMTTYVLEDDGQTAPKTQAIRGGRYYCVTTDTLEGLLEQAGFNGVQTLRDRFFQPLLVGLKR
jgi:SAM-dependent methyltransferase